LLAQAKLPWRRVHWYLGDERCYPAGHAGRNDVMLETELWSRIVAPAGNRHPMAAELGAEVAADRYAEQIRAAGRLDIVLLGMGEDGHTASLFPDNAALADPRPVVAVHDAPKPPPERVSLGLVTLRDAAERIVLVSGRDKRDALRRVQAGAMLPVNRIGTLLWFIDAEAGAGP
jgi:6-phosphogluconolactonase